MRIIDRKIEADLQTSIVLEGAGENITMKFNLWRQKESGNYGGTHAGAMCPTDDVLAHLLLMRGDERLFWSRANQHPANRPEAGLG